MKIVSRMRNQSIWSRWYAQMVDHKDYFMVKDDEEFHLGGIPQGIKSKFDRRRYRCGISRHIKLLISNGGKWIFFYCHSGHTDPYTFVKWVNEKNYHFTEAYGFEKHGNFWTFHGNLVEVSCAFAFRIFDQRVAQNVRAYIYRNLDIPKKTRTCLHCRQEFEVKREGHHWHTRKCRDSWYRRHGKE